MSSRRIHRRVPRTPEQQEELRSIRRRFQAARPTPEHLVASGDVAGFVPLGEYIDLREAMLALKRQRERLGLSLAAVAKRSKIDKAAISRLENGLQANPTVDTLHRYASAIGAEIAWIVRTPQGTGERA